MNSLYTDGGSRGNPGMGAAAAVLYDADNNLIEIDGKYLGEVTNNFAEYQGLVFGLKMAIKQKVKDLVVYMDSELIIMQVNGAYRVKSPDLKPMFEEVKDLKQKFDSIKFAHVRREKNKVADKLVNVILDAVSGK